MTVLAIDPGPEQSAYVLFDGARVEDHNIIGNWDIFHELQVQSFGAVVLEQIESFGMAVGKEVFETVFWTGRFYQASMGTRVERLSRRDVKLHLCQSARAKDTNVRQALIDRFGGLDKARGKKASPGPLYGLRSHEWSALALAVTWWDLRRPVEPEIAVTPNGTGLLRCVPQGHGKAAYGHVWTSSAPEAICQCGTERYDGRKEARVDE